MNGMLGDICTPVFIIAYPLVDLSISLFDWNPKKLVPDIAVNGVVGGVNDAVYWAVPFIALRLLIYPLKYTEPLLLEYPILGSVCCKVDVCNLIVIHPTHRLRIF